MSSVPNPGDALAVEADPLAAAPVEGEYTWAADAQPKLVVTRGLKQNVEYPLYPGQNFLGRADDKPVDVDLDDQEPPDRVWSSRQHAVIIFENGQLTLEDLNSANGTYVNRERVFPGQKRGLKVGDVIQLGTIHLKVTI